MWEVKGKRGKVCEKARRNLNGGGGKRLEECKGRRGELRVSAPYTIGWYG